MKRIAVLVLLLFLSTGCGMQTISQQAVTAAGGTWSAELLGGSGPASGFSFITNFTINATNYTLSVEYFQFLTNNTGGACSFPNTGEIPTGQLVLSTDNSTGYATGAFTYTVKSSSDKLTLTGNLTGTATLTGTTLNGGTITGKWQVSGSSACTGSGTFTMTQAAPPTTTSGSGG